MACDSRYTLGRRVLSYRTKIIKTAYGLFAAAGEGDSRAVDALGRSITGPELLPTTEELLALDVDQHMLFAFNDGRLFMMATGKKGIECWVEEVSGVGYAAIGSGAPFALGAMAAGATAERAAKIACEFDTASGLPVYMFHLDPPEGVQTC